MAGAILIETIFDWARARAIRRARVAKPRLSAIMGIAILYGVVFSLVNILTDIVYGMLDPRIRYG